MMEYFVVALLLCSFVIAEELDKNDNIYRIDNRNSFYRNSSNLILQVSTKVSTSNVVSTITVQADLKEPGLTVFSYVDRLEYGVEKSWKGNIFTESCSTLKQMGVNEPGLYLLNDKGIAFCDMSKDWNDSNIQTGVGRLRFKDVV